MVFEYIPGPKHGLDVIVLGDIQIGALIKCFLTKPVQVGCLNLSLKCLAIFEAPAWQHPTVYLLYVWLGWNFHRGAYKALRRGRTNMDVSLGTNTAYIYSVLNLVVKWIKASQGSEFYGADYFEISALLISFISLGKFLEVHAKGKTSWVQNVYMLKFVCVCNLSPASKSRALLTAGCIGLLSNCGSQ